MAFSEVGDKPLPGVSRNQVHPKHVCPIAQVYYLNLLSFSECR